MNRNHWPSIDHSLLSPSGKVSKRAAKAAHARMVSELFPPGFWEKLKTGPSLEAQRDAALSMAKMYRGFVASGWRPRAHLREALRQEAIAAEFDRIAAETAEQ